jgi:hypothetical protein
MIQIKWTNPCKINNKPITDIVISIPQFKFREALISTLINIDILVSRNSALLYLEFPTRLPERNSIKDLELNDKYRIIN